MPCIVREKATRNGKPRSPFWYCAFRDATGRRLKKSTGQTSKSKALKVCMQLQRAADLARERALTEERARAIISDENDISDRSKSAKRSWRQNISEGWSTVGTRLIPSGATLPSRIGHVLGFDAIPRLS